MIDKYVVRYMSKTHGCMRYIGVPCESKATRIIHSKGNIEEIVFLSFGYLMGNNILINDRKDAHEFDLEEAKYAIIAMGGRYSRLEIVNVEIEDDE